jgi:hypothetical protein
MRLLTFLLVLILVVALFADLSSAKRKKWKKHKHEDKSGKPKSLKLLRFPFHSQITNSCMIMFCPGSLEDPAGGEVTTPEQEACMKCLDEKGSAADEADVATLHTFLEQCNCDSQQQ